jgi:PAS domain S-box-containing protein
MTKPAPPPTDLHLDLLEQDEAHFERFAENSDDVYWLADLPSGRLLYVNAQFERLWGLPREQLMADPGLWNRSVVDEDRPSLPLPFFADDPGSDSGVREYRIDTAGGAQRWIRDRRFHLRDSTGRTVRIGGIAEDATPHKTREIEREGLLARERAARTEAQELARSKDEFLAVVTHELRSPLNAIRGWAHVLRRAGALNEMQLKALDVIDRNTVAQAQMVDELLDGQRILCGDLRLEMGSAPLEQIIGEAVEAVQPAAGAKHIRVLVSHDPAAGLVSVDVARLRQALTSLLSNAVKFTPNDGTIEVRSEAAPDSVAIEVQDNGIGLEPSELPFVFDRFRQADASNTRRQNGLGLGLSLARQLIELHGGRISAESDGAGCGARFTIHLPQSPDAVNAADAPPASGVGAALAGKRVVIVEDDDDGREVLALILGEAHVHLRSFDRSAAAYDYIKHAPPGEQPDALISDIAMPDEDGYAFIRRLRRMEEGERRPHLVALALTSFGRAEDRMRALKAGFDAHVSKPIDSETVLKTIMQALRAHDAPAAA